MENEMDQSLFEDESTLHFGGEEGEEFDYLAGFDDDTGSVQGAPTTEQNAAEQAEEGSDTGEAANAESGGEDTGDAHTTEQTGDQAGKLTFKAKIDHQEQDVSIGTDELPTLYQKAQNMDRAVQRANQAQQDVEQYRRSMAEFAAKARALGAEGETPTDVLRTLMDSITSSARTQQIEDLVSGGTAKEVAEFVVDQRMKSAAAQEPQSEPEVREPEANEEQEDSTHAEDGAQEPPTPEQFNLDLHKLLSLRPEILESGKPFPDEVLNAYMKGENLTVAYLDYESKQTAAEKQTLEKQNRIFQQNQESAKRAPVRGVAGSGGIDSKQDPWLAGIDDPYW